MTAPADFLPGTAVLIVCGHGEMLASGTVLERFEAPCECGGPGYLVRLNGAREGETAGVCARSLRRPN